MDTHIRALGRINIAFGLLSAVLVIATVVSYGSLNVIVTRAQTDFVVAALLASIVFHAAVAIPCVFLGIVITRYHEWARLLLIILSALNLLNIPLGSVVGAYGLWVLMTPETEPLFLDPPRRKKSHKSPPKPAVVKQKPVAKVLRSRGADIGPQ